MLHRIGFMGSEDIGIQFRAQFMGVSFSIPCRPLFFHDMNIRSLDVLGKIILSRHENSVDGSNFIHIYLRLSMKRFRSILVPN